MIGKIAKRGTSFKGAGMYYLHDKREAGEDIRTTSERVAWTDTRNLASNDPDFSLKVMAATAMDKERLKAQAGISNAGRKTKGDVYAYSLAWHPDEQGKFNKAEMLQAADQSLKALGAQEHQALIVSHQDEGHPHIHIIVNMVHPETGKNFKNSNDRNKLNKWSNDYRKARNEEHIYCPNKAKKYEAIEDKKRGHKIPFIKGEKDIAHQLHKSFKDASKEARQSDLKAARTSEGQKDGALSQSGREMHSRHSNQWAALSDNYALRKKNISKEYTREKEDVTQVIKAQMKPAFGELDTQQWQERKAFEAREKRVTGKLKNMLEAVKFAKSVRGEENSHLVGKIFNFFSDVSSRAAWLNAKHNNQIKILRTEKNRQIKDAVSLTNEQRQRRQKSARQDFKIDREALISKQGSEKEDLKLRWKARNKQRNAAIKSLKVKAYIAPKDEELLKHSEKKTMKKDFKDRAKKRGRSRTRKRTRDD